MITLNISMETLKIRRALIGVLENWRDYRYQLQLSISVDGKRKAFLNKTKFNNYYHGFSSTDDTRWETSDQTTPKRTQRISNPSTVYQRRKKKETQNITA